MQIPVYTYMYTYVQRDIYLFYKYSDQVAYICLYIYTDIATRVYLHYGSLLRFLSVFSLTSSTTEPRKKVSLAPVLIRLTLTCNMPPRSQ